MNIVNFIQQFKLTSNFVPYVVASFEGSPSTATIKVYSVINGENLLINILDNECIRIGDTNKFIWSTENLPNNFRIGGQFLYEITSDELEVFIGQFILTSIENNKRLVPRNKSDYILEI
jgi:hypothetical protein